MGTNYYIDNLEDPCGRERLDSDAYNQGKGWS